MAAASTAWIGDITCKRKEHGKAWHEKKVSHEQKHWQNERQNIKAKWPQPWWRQGRKADAGKTTNKEIYFRR